MLLENVQWTGRISKSDMGIDVPIVPLIMCGGAGTRLWPASREGRPKQFLPLFGQYSTFQDTIRRVRDQTLFGRPIVITNAQYRFLVAEQLTEIGTEADIILEPVRRDSAPALAAGALFATRRAGDAIVVALAADHVINDPLAFADSCRVAGKIAGAGHIVSFGVQPTRPATEYGYICPGALIGANTFAVERFVEKPNLATAKKYIEQGYFWNSGNFIFPAKLLLEEYKAYEPDSAAAIEAAVDRAGSDLGFITLDKSAFTRAIAKSIDYAVMERTRRAAVMPVSYGWSDVGSWQAVWEQCDHDEFGNSSQGSVVIVNSQGCYAATTKKQLVSLLGVENLVIVATEDAVLVTKRNQGDELRQLVGMLKKTTPAVTDENLKVHRPWGSYQSVDQGDRFQVKRIVVKRGKRLSLQRHHHRAEHWVVVRGTARVIVDGETKILHENESTYIAIGAKHRLENPGKIDLELIEIQTGSYLGEDDIERFEDDYRRS